MVLPSLSLDEQFFVKIALKNNLVQQDDADECIRVRIALAKRGKEKLLQEIMLDTGLLSPGEVDLIVEAQMASQVVRLDAIYAEIARKKGLAAGADIAEAFAHQHERGHRARLGEILVDRGVLRPEQHRQVLVLLLQSIKGEEKEYIRRIRQKRKLAPEREDEGERIRRALTVEDRPAPGATTEPAPPRASPPPSRAAPSAPPPAPPAPPPTSAPPEPPAGPAAAEAPEPAEAPRPAVPAAQLASPAPPAEPQRPPVRPRPKPVDESDEALKLSSTSGTRALGTAPEAAPSLHAFDETIPPEAPAPAPPPPRAPRSPSKKKPARRPPPPKAAILESAVREREESPLEGKTSLLESDAATIEGDLEDVEALITSGVKSFAELGGRRRGGRTGSSAGRPTFNAEEYLRRRSRRRLAIRAAIFLAVLLVATPFAVAAYVARANQTALDEARAYLDEGELDVADEALAGVVTFWPAGWLADLLGAGDPAASALRRELDFARWRAGIRAAIREKKHDEALARLLSARQGFGDFAAETSALETELALARQLDVATRHLEAGELAEAVRAYRRARDIAPGDPAAEESIAAIRRGLEDEIAAAERAGDPLAVIAAKKKLREIVGEDRGVETAMLEYELAMRLELGDKARDGRDPKTALDHYYLAKEAAQRLGRPNATREVSERIRATNQLAKFRELLNQGQILEERGRLEEAIHQYRAAVAWASSDETRQLCEGRIRECEKKKGREKRSVEVERLSREAIAALKASRPAQAKAAAEALERLDPEEPKYRKLKEFADGVADMIYVPAAEFTMGSTDPELGDEYPQRRVFVQAFFIDRHEVQNKQYEAFLEARGSGLGIGPPPHWTRERGGGPGRDPGDGHASPRAGARTYGEDEADHPVTNVTEEEAEAFASFAGKRLPREDEWEKAARGGDARIYPWGSKVSGVRAHVNASGRDGDGGGGGSGGGGGGAGASGSKPVGTSPDDESPHGLMDMGGNVREWTASPYRPYPGGEERGSGFTDEKRVVRGGAWCYDWGFARCANREGLPRSGERDLTIGFRCARDIPDFLPELN